MACDLFSCECPIPVLFQFARHERNFNQKAMETYYAAAGQPKEVKWYSTGHELNDPAALKDRARWIAQQLKLSYDDLRQF